MYVLSSEKFLDDWEQSIRRARRRRRRNGSKFDKGVFVHEYEDARFPWGASK